MHLYFLHLFIHARFLSFLFLPFEGCSTGSRKLGFFKPFSQRSLFFLFGGYSSTFFLSMILFNAETAGELEQVYNIS